MNDTNFTITLQSRRLITLESLDQTRTYAGLLMGTPNKATNDSYIAHRMALAKQHHSYPTTPYLIEPPLRDYDHRPGDMDRVRQMSSRVPEFMPSICCTAVFNSFQPRQGAKHDFSYLCVVWFQDAFALPIAAPVLAHLGTMNWDTYAADGDY